MPEIRQDVTTKEWVIIANERARRPDDFKKSLDRTVQKSLATHCPFCPGNESMTPGELYRQALPVKVNGADWGLRAVPNLFPALIPEGSLSRIFEGSLFHRLDGVGQHEVVIETPFHNRFLFDMADS